MNPLSLLLQTLAEVPSQASLRDVSARGMSWQHGLPVRSAVTEVHDFHFVLH